MQEKFSIIKANIDHKSRHVSVKFSDNPDISWKFHYQWLANSDCSQGFSKSAVSSPFMQDNKSVDKVTILTSGDLMVTWLDQSSSVFPSIWLKTLACEVASPDKEFAVPMSEPVNYWYANTLTIPEVGWDSIMNEDCEYHRQSEKVIDLLVKNTEYGIVKITDCPKPDFESERKTENTLLTKLLRKLFGSVFFHPRRGADKTFNVSSDNAVRAAKLDNYDVSKILLPHTDHAHYIHPAMVMGLYALEGVSVNTWLDGFTALKVLKEEDPQSYACVTQAPLTFGRIAKYYSPALIQANTDTAVTFVPGKPNQVKRIKWHPHLIGWPCCSFADYEQVIAALQKFQSIMLRPEIKLEVTMNPGDMYIWNNFRILHGRQSVLATPRTSVGQTVPEEVVMDTLRNIKIAKIKTLNDDWLAQIPTALLDELYKYELLKL